MERYSERLRQKPVRYVRRTQAASKTERMLHLRKKLFVKWYNEAVTQHLPATKYPSLIIGSCARSPTRHETKVAMSDAPLRLVVRVFLRHLGVHPVSPSLKLPEQGIGQRGSGV